MLNTIALTSPFETQLVLQIPHALSWKARHSVGCIHLKTRRRKRSEALFQKLWVKKQSENDFDADRSVATESPER